MERKGDSKHTKKISYFYGLVKTFLKPYLILRAKKEGKIMATKKYRKMAFSIWCLGAILLIAACAMTSTQTFGVDFDKTKAASIVKGQTTKQDIVQLLGQPFDKELDVSGLEKWVYLHRVTTITSKPPIFGPQAGEEGTVKESKLEIVFEQDTVKNFVTSESTTPWTASAPQYKK
jgi:outer membrane protein assembly factor BamE (lipoprotein component of BamABCDE complex)